MDTGFILEQVKEMMPTSFSAQEEERYVAEKMLMRQFMLIKEQNQVPDHLSTRDMKAWLLAGRSFLEEFQEMVKVAEARKLVLAELAWIAARHLCVNQMEQELQEELEKEKRLSQQFGRKVTLEGLQMFLSTFHPKAEQVVRSFLGHLSNSLLSSCTGFHTSKRSKLALLIKLQQTTAPLVMQTVDTALEFLLCVSPVEVRPSHAEQPITSKNSSLASAGRTRAKAAGSQIGKQLADAVATCFCLNTCYSRAHLLCTCTSVAQNMVKAIYKRFVSRSKSFYLLDFDESFVTARQAVICAMDSMDGRERRTAISCPLSEQCSEIESMSSEMCHVTAEQTDDKNDKERMRSAPTFSRRLWKKMLCMSTEE
ncbi:uncharacterized protein LOC125022722 [Mugil cephalus]|uniref:uncharacterized protein LOC125022722 n=1 Tax=Mugil cephalus TaxID=48193 RepID=UPI001FB74DFD|nr:uncharacterized protein LOC125022722 [Mugil cephalus]